MPSLPLKRKHVVIGTVLIVMALGAGAIAHKRSDGKLKPAQKADTPTVMELAPNDLLAVAAREVPVSVPIAGTLNALKQVQVIAPYEGRILDVLVRPGDRVEAGQVLAHFDEADLRARLAERRAALSSAEEQMRVAERNRDSNRALLDRNFISKNAYDNTLGGYAERQAAVDAQRSQLALVDRALKDARLIAPFAGAVSARNVEPGQWVEPNRKLFSVIDLKRLELEASVPNQHLARLAIGQPVSFHAEGYGDQSFSGKLVRISPSTQAGTRSLLAYVSVDNNDEKLRAGLYASGYISVGAPKLEIRLPLAAIQRSDKGEGVWLVEKQVLAWRPVSYERLSAEEARVVSGLQGGEQLVVTPLKGAKAGLAVRLPQAAKAKSAS